MDALPGQPRLPFAPFLEVRGLHPELSVSSLFTALQGRGGRQGLHTGFGQWGQVLGPVQVTRAQTPWGLPTSLCPSC